jgi:stage III sporulation protein AE
MQVLANEEEEAKDEILSQFEFDELDQALENLFPEQKMSFQDLLGVLIRGDGTEVFEVIKQLFLDQLFYEIKNSKDSIVQILLLVIFATIFTNISNVFQSAQAAEISFMMLYMLVIGICLNNFRILADLVATNVANLISFVEVLSPAFFLAVTMATGGSTSAAFSQMVLLFIFLIELTILNFLIPMVQLYLMMKVIGEFSPEIKLTKFAEFMETFISWALKIVAGSVIGMNLIQGLLAPAIDSLKRSVLVRGGESIPFIGNIVGGGAEVVLGTAVLIRNGIGIVGMIGCVVVCIGPIVQIGVSTLLYQLTAALIQPVSDKRIVNCVSGMADGTKILLRILITTGTVFLLTIAVVTTTGGR